MTWKTICLELARSQSFPNGSASRAYLLHLPLDTDGRVDEEALRRAPALATVRRHWPNERDRSGRLIRKRRGWAFSYVSGAEEDEDICHIEPQVLRPGVQVTITEPDGEHACYRVMRCDGADSLRQAS